MRNFTSANLIGLLKIFNKYERSVGLNAAMVNNTEVQIGILIVLALNDYRIVWLRYETHAIVITPG